MGIGPFLNETVDLIRNIKNLTIVKGNHERYMFEDLSTEIMDDTEIEHYRWESLLLTDVNRSFLKDISYEISIIIDEVSIRVVHYSMNEQKKYNEIINNPTIEDGKYLYEQLEIEYDSSLVVSKILELNSPASKEILKYFYGITDENI